MPIITKYFISGNTWHYLSHKEHFKTASASVYSEHFDAYFTYGGYDLNQVLDEFVMYNFTKSAWISINNTLPGPLFEHTMTMLPDEQSFVIFGGKSQNGSISNRLWHYSISNNEWTLKAQNSLIQPPGLTKHTLTLAGDYLYLFGGSLEHDGFSNQMFRIESSNLTQWEKLNPKGKMTELYVTGHSMVYYAELNSLLLFGGLRSDVRRFAQLSDLMFQFDVKSQTWVRLQLDKYSVERNYVPAERAFHSAQIMGNYMVVFGGFSHKHNQVETCQDKNLYFFHLGCMTWVRFF